MQHISLTPDEELISLIYETFFYVNMHGSYKLVKTVRF